MRVAHRRRRSRQIDGAGSHRYASNRLKEEREREMTIDLGFAWLTLPGGEAIGIVDVPGHIDFIENMLAGVGSLDAALFVIAADEGVMPQTREHLAILDLLKIDAGVVALTKIDLVEAEWLELIQLDVREALRGRAVLRLIVSVSADRAGCRSAARNRSRHSAAPTSSRSRPAPARDRSRLLRRRLRHRRHRHLDRRLAARGR
jgi:translation elongation factor EF-Tu-like GTPase